MGNLKIVFIALIVLMTTACSVSMNPNDFIKATKVCSDAGTELFELNYDVVSGTHNVMCINHHSETFASSTWESLNDG